MPGALFVNIPARGHIHPTLPVVADLVALGERVTYCLPAEDEALIRPTGAGFRAVGNALPEAGDRRGGSMSLAELPALAIRGATRTLHDETTPASLREAVASILADDGLTARLGAMQAAALAGGGHRRAAQEILAFAARVQADSARWGKNGHPAYARATLSAGTTPSPREVHSQRGYSFGSLGRSNPLLRHV